MDNGSDLCRVSCDARLLPDESLRFVQEAGRVAARLRDYPAGQAVGLLQKHLLHHEHVQNLSSPISVTLPSIRN